jgi:hypothetical protein
MMATGTGTSEEPISTPRRFIGYHEPSSLPVRAGDIVTIPRGTKIRTTRPGAANKVKTAGRTYRVKVDHVLTGRTVSVHVARADRGETPGPKEPPSIRWAGTGGYWFEVDINDVPEVQAAIAAGHRTGKYVMVRREELAGWSKTGVAWRAYEADGSSMYLGAETYEGLVERVREEWPNATFDGDRP